MESVSPFIPWVAGFMRIAAGRTITPVSVHISTATSGWSTFWTVMAGVGGGAVGASATAWATHRTLKAEIRLADTARSRAAQDAFKTSVARAYKELLSADNFLSNIQTPDSPFFTFDHRWIDDVLSYAELPNDIAGSIQKAALALRSYNAAAEYGNEKRPMTGYEGPALTRWSEARGLVRLAQGDLMNWLASNSEDSSGTAKP
jgi:hypothetical protein